METQKLIIEGKLKDKKIFELLKNMKLAKLDKINNVDED
jgi:hypothetical protein